MVGRNIVLATLALAAAAPAAANRMLDVLPSMKWQHARTGLVMGPYLGSLPRGGVGDYGTEEADLFLDYRGADGTVATIYVFHPGLDSVPLWFDRVQAQIFVHQNFGKPGDAIFGKPGDATAKAFAIRPGAPAASLRIAYPMQGGDIASTAAAVVPVADWLVVVRLSSPKLAVAELDAELTRILDDISWPADKLDAPVAVPVAACAELPVFHKAKLLQPDIMQALLGGIASQVEDKEKKPVPTFCRAQQEPAAQWGVYRAAGEGKGYVLALADAGRAIAVDPSLAAEVHKTKPAFSLRFMDLTQQRTYPDVSDQLPPEQALEIVNTTNPIASAGTLDHKGSITINSAVTEKK